MNVFEINNSVKAIQEKVNAGDLTPEQVADTLASLKDTRNHTLDSVASWYEQNEARIDWLTKKAQQIRKLKSHYKTLNENLMQFMTKAIDGTGHKSLQTENHILRTRNYKASTVVDSTMDLPIDYVERKTVLKPDKRKLYKDLKAGKPIKGAHLEPNRKTIIE